MYRQLLYVILGLLLISACGTSGFPPPSSPPDAVFADGNGLRSDPIDLRIAVREGPIGDGLTAVIPEWEALTGNTVEIVPLPYAYLQRSVFTDVQTGGGQFDLVMLDDPWLPSLAGEGYLIPLEQFGYQTDADFVLRSLQVASWPPPIGAIPPDSSPQETPRLYALPLIGNVQMFWYRKDKLGELPPSLPDFMALVRETAVSDDRLSGYAYRSSWGNPIVTEFNAWNWAYGGGIFDEDWQVILNEPASVQALTDFIQFTADVTPYSASYNSGGDIVDALLDGSALAGIVWPSENMRLLDDERAANIGVTLFPGDVRQTSQLGNWLLGVPTTSPNKQVAYDLLLWLTSRETMTILAEKGLPPTRISVFNDPELVEHYWWLPQTQAALEQGTWRPRMPEWNKVEHILGNYLARAIQNEMTPQEALDRAAVDIEAVLENADYLD